MITRDRFIYWIKTIAGLGVLLYILYEILWSLWIPFPDTLQPIIDNGIDYWYDYLTCTASITASLIGGAMILKISKKADPRVRVGLIVGLLFLYNIIIATLITIIQVHFIRLEVSDRWSLQGELFNIFNLSTMSTILSLIIVIKRLNEDIISIEREISEKKTQEIQNQLDLLHAYINPHFLFNSLNTIGALITEQPRKAEIFVDHLSYILRYMLQNRHNHLVPLNDELENMNNYVYIVKVRFGDEVNINVDKRIKENSHQVMICPGTLQLLLENAIKHNKHSMSSPLNISLIDESDHIKVINTLNPLESNNVVSFGLGKKSIETRFSIIKCSGVSQYIENDRYVVVIPKIFEKK
ncbi:MAG: histidine kinase [Muribaculaceae bacterium]|nr:histidine kinase [Muribaculaceae bacterium]